MGVEGGINWDVKGGGAKRGFNSYGGGGISFKGESNSRGNSIQRSIQFQWGFTIQMRIQFNGVFNSKGDSQFKGGI